MLRKKRGQYILIQRMSLAFLLSLLTLGPMLFAETVPVRHMQGTAHGFLVIKSLEGVIVATGDSIQVAHADRVFSHLIFHFRDGSIDDETTVFSQRGHFQLIRDHHIQRGPSFPKPIDLLVEASSGQITSRSIGSDGKVKITQEHLDLPPDVANGLTLTLLENLRSDTPETKVSMVAPTSKPRLITLSVKPDGEQTFLVGGVHRKAIDFDIKIEFGGFTGVVAPLIGKQPADPHVWILGGEAPAFIREEGQLYEGGPIWRIEQISPEFSHVRAH